MLRDEIQRQQVRQKEEIKSNKEEEKQMEEIKENKNLIKIKGKKRDIIKVKERYIVFFIYSRLKSIILNHLKHTNNCFVLYSILG